MQGLLQHVFQWKVALDLLRLLRPLVPLAHQDKQQNLCNIEPTGPEGRQSMHLTSSS